MRVFQDEVVERCLDACLVKLPKGVDHLVGTILDKSVKDGTAVQIGLRRASAELEKKPSHGLGLVERQRECKSQGKNGVGGLLVAVEELDRKDGIRAKLREASQFPNINTSFMG